MESKKKALVIATVLAAAVVLMTMLLSAGQSGRNAGTIGKGNQTRILQDMKGNKILVADPLGRVALLGGPTGQVAYIMGAQDRLCAVTESLRTSSLVHIMDPRMATVPGPRTVCGSINIEALIQAEPDLVIAGDIDGGIVERKTSIPVVYLEDSMGQGFSELKKEIRFYGYVFQTPDRAERYITYLEDTIRFIRSRTGDIPEEGRKVVYNGFSPNHLVTLGGDTFMQERIETAGCINAAKAITTTGKREGLHSGLDEVSMEQVLGWNPDVIVIDMGTPDEIYADPRWSEITAVKNRRVHVQPYGVFIWNRPTAESAVLNPLWLACIAYPERFKDIDIVAEVQRFYREIFDFDLTEQQARALIEGVDIRTIVVFS